MNSDEISAFEAYSKKRLKKKSFYDLNFGAKSFDKFKKKKLQQKKKKLKKIASKSTTEFGYLDSETQLGIEKLVKPKKLNKTSSKTLKECKKITNASKAISNGVVKENGLKLDELPRNSNEISKPNLKVKKSKGEDFQNGETNKTVGQTEPVLPVNEDLKPLEEKNFEIKNSLSKNLNIVYSDSVKVGEEVLSWLLSPVEIKTFFKEFWEKKPLYIKRSNENFFKCICTLKDFKLALKETDMYFTKNIDVTSYLNGERFTENPDGKATFPVVWDFYNNGKSIRLLNPQTFIPNIRLLNTTLQEFFHCFVGSNIYLTPAGTQGFAPHYDDIEAFVLQLEGEKQWELYNPRNSREVLPRESSKNFKEDEIGNPILEVTLKPGDLLYFPRGTIHQAKCLPHSHSFHLTVSCYQKNSWADLFEKVLPVALQTAISEDVEFRKGLPIGYPNHLGMIFSEQGTQLREQFIRKFNELGKKLLEFCPLDAGVDQLAADFIHDALPPYLTEEEKLYGGDRNVRYKNKSFLYFLKKYPDKNLGVKLIRATSVRLVSEESEMCLYYTTDNSLTYHEMDVSCANIPMSWTLALECLIQSYPSFVNMQNLPVAGKDDKPGTWKDIANFVYFFWQRGLVLFDRPFQSIYNS